MQKSDPSHLQLDDQFVSGSCYASNPARQVFTNTGFTYWDTAPGIKFTSVAGADTRYFLGAALSHFTNPKVAFQKHYDIVLDPKWVMNAGLVKLLGDVNKLTVYADRFMQGVIRQVQGGLLRGHDFYRMTKTGK